MISALPSARFASRPDSVLPPRRVFSDILAEMPDTPTIIHADGTVAPAAPEKPPASGRLDSSRLIPVHVEIPMPGQIPSTAELIAKLKASAEARARQALDLLR